MEKTIPLKFARKGQVFTGVSAIILLAVGVGIATVVTVFMGVLAGQTFSLTQTQIDAINDTTIRESVESSITYAFQAQEQSAQYSPLLILAVAIGVILTVVLSIPLVSSLLGGGGGGMGGAL